MLLVSPLSTVYHHLPGVCKVAPAGCSARLQLWPAARTLQVYGIPGPTQLWQPPCGQSSADAETI